MNDIEMQKLIENIVGRCIGELKLQDMLKENKKNAFQKTEQLLYNYVDFKDVIKQKKTMIDDLLKYGLPKKSKSITSFSGDEGMREVKTEQEQIDEYVASIENSMRLTIRCVSVIDDALKSVSNDPYYNVIEERYFNKKNLEDIAEDIEKDVSTVSRNKNRLVNMIKIKIFPDESINEIMHQ